MNCEEVSELLPAYVIGALDADEVEAIEAHLRQGREHDGDLVELRATVFALDRYEADVEPSPALAHRVQAIVASEATVIPLPARRGQAWFPAFGWRPAVAAAVIVAAFVAGILAGGVVGNGGDEVVALALQSEDGAFMEVRGTTGAGSVTVTMAGLERLTDRSYQVWAVRDGEWYSIGVCNTNAEGRWVGDFEFGLERDEAVALTVEPFGGSEQPTSAPILQSQR